MWTFVQISTVCTARKASTAVKACRAHTQLEAAVAIIADVPLQFFFLVTLTLFSHGFYCFITSISHLKGGANY